MYKVLLNPFLRLNINYSLKLIIQPFRIKEVK
ncbi:MAG: hypothetical protein RLZZ628_3920 [Bacteroidota bacterium]|jgi:hypothetical protein